MILIITANNISPPWATPEVPGAKTEEKEIIRQEEFSSCAENQGLQKWFSQLITLILTSQMVSLLQNLQCEPQGR